MLKKKYLNWFKKIYKYSKPKVYQVDLKKIKNWNFKKDKIHHISNRFFSIKYYEVKNKFRKKSSIFYSPFIDQKEVGILGILIKKFKNDYKYLLQAKFEPGNINKIQISPTLQATKSNYTKVHKGKKANFVNLFLNALNKKNYIFKKKLPEQGTRYLNKYNENIIIKIKNEKFEIPKGFLWVNKDEIKELLKKNNLINMDTLSVLSCIVKKDNKRIPLNDNIKIINKVSSFIKQHKQEINPINLKDLKGWNYQNKQINNINKKYFSVIGIRTVSNSREVKSWDQPILKEYHKGLIGLIVKRINGSLHYYMQIVKEPGYKKPLLTGTISIKDFSIKDYKNHIFINILKKKNKSKILFNRLLSEEGGRFYHKQNKNIVLEVKKTVSIIEKNNYIWISHNQMVDLIKKGIISIEARNLFVSFNIDKIL